MNLRHLSISYRYLGGYLPIIIMVILILYKYIKKINYTLSQYKI